MNGSVLMFVDHEYEELELHYPRYRLIEAGFKVVVAAQKANQEYRGKHGYPAKADVSIDEMDEKDFVGLVIPGGYAPDKLRRNRKVLALTKAFHEKEKLIAYICHAGWVPISAKIVQSFKCTSTPAIKDDLMNAGASWVDEPVVVDRHHITSRGPDDLPFFCTEILNFLKTKNSNHVFNSNG